MSWIWQMGWERTESRSSPENIADGVWAVVTSADGHIREDMRIHGTRVSSDGRRMALFREYHLCGIETPLSIAQAALLGASSGLPTRNADFGGAGICEARPAAGGQAGRFGRAAGVRTDRSGRDDASGRRACCRWGFRTGRRCGRRWRRISRYRRGRWRWMRESFVARLRATDSKQ